MRVYTFHREDDKHGKLFYPVTLKDDDDAIANAHANPGTLRVEDMYGKVVWEKDKAN